MMKAWNSLSRLRLYGLLVAAWRAIYRYPWLLLLLPLAIFFPLLDNRGLYEFGDANFPLNPFWLDYMLPWSGAASAGADNTFIGVPRLAYHVIINVLIASTHNLQVSQWIWYSGMTALGLGGAYLLARRLGAGIYAIPLAIFYACNIWSYDRIAQGCIYLSYQALPLAIYLFLRYLGRPTVARALYFACALLFIIPALQISYLAALICGLIAVRQLVIGGWRVLLHLAGIAAAVVAANAFYVFSMVADAVLNSGGNIALVNSRFNLGVFEHYAARVTIPNTLAMASFYYSSIDQQWRIVAIASTLVPILLIGLLLLARRPTLRSKFYAGLGLTLLGVWLVDGIVINPGLYDWFRTVVPGLRSFVEPDYFSPVYIFGAFVMLAAWARLGARAYAPLWNAAVWIVALGGVVAFLPINGPSSGMPQTGQPRQYTEFSRAHVPGYTLWMPPDRGVKYRWSPYVINGFTSLNSPTDALGPSMAESLAPGTGRIEGRLSQAFLNTEVRTVKRLAPIMNVGTVAISADSLSPFFEWPNYEVVGSLDTLSRLEASGFFKPRSDESDVGVHLVTATSNHDVPELGVYDAPVAIDGFDDFMWRSAVDTNDDYRPIVMDLSPADAAKLGLRTLEAPNVSSRYVPITQFDGTTHCSGSDPLTPLDKPAQPMKAETSRLQLCFVLKLRDIRHIAALQILPRGAGQFFPQLRYQGNHRHDWDVDPTVPALEMPPWPDTAWVQLRLPEFSSALLDGVEYKWVATSQMRRLPLPAGTCRASDVTSSESNPMSYAVSANLSGRCTVIFRQSFSPIWSISVASGNAKIGGHLQVDGFANGWLVDGSGPATFRIVNRALYPYVWGMAITIASLLLALGFAIRSWLRAAAAKRRATVPSPA
ncbi:MAG TPA: hypothetical protein VGG89_13145 [Candidatus Baltobacteraceae bacterium]